MSLVGSLEDLGLGDILQIVSLSRKSGVLNLSWGEVKGKIIFKDGQVVAATSTDREKSLPGLLADKGALSGDKVQQASDAINAASDSNQAARVLVEDMGITSDTVESTIHEKIESTVFHFFSWPEGSFSFELQEIDDEIGGLKPPEHAFVLEIGLSPQFLAMEGTRLQDEMKRDSAEAPVGPPRKKQEEAGEMSPEDIDIGVAPSGSTEKPPPSLEETVAPPPPEEDEDSETDFSSVADAVKYYESVGGGESETETSSAPGEEAPQESPPEESAAPEPEETPPPKPEPGKGGPRIVVADEDQVMLDALSHHLEKKGYTVHGYTTVKGALSTVQELVEFGEKPVAVVIDVLMPNSEGSSTMGGLELLEQVRRTNSSIPIYMMTDYENAIAREKSDELGARYFFMKPKSSQIDEDYSSPELTNFVSVLENGITSERPEAPESRPAKEEPSDTINLGEELRREFGEEEPDPSAYEEDFTPSRGLNMLKAMINELNDPSANGQITLMILRFAAELMNRAVIFLVAKNQLAGLGQFGIEIDGADPQKHVRQMRIPLNQPSIFREAIQKRMPIKKKLKKNKWNEYLVEHLGGAQPSEVFVAPIIAGGKIPALIYGDNAPEDKEIGDTESLEIFLAQAGLAMEKALLERRLQEIGPRSSEIAG